MKLFFTLTLICLLTITGFSQLRYFYGELSGANEVPPSGSTATGVVLLKLNTLNNAIELFGNYNGLSSTITGSHIHEGAAGVNGSVIVGLANTGGTSGTLSFSGALTDAQETVLLAGNMYVNVHSTNFPGGEIRSQLTAVANGEAVFLNARLQGAQEMPPNPSAGSGISNILVDNSTNKVYLTGSYTNLTTGATVSHIHVGRVGVNGGTIVTLQNSGGTTGTLHGVGTLTDARKDSLINARTYVNVHTSTYPGGELRGQVNTFSQQQQFFGGRLSGANEAPPNGSSATGTVIVRYNMPTKEIELVGDYQGLTGTITGSHIHTGAAGTNGSVIVTLNNTGGPIGVLTVLATLTEVQETALLNGGLYVNVHSTTFPGGEIRTQLIPQTVGETQYFQAQLTGTQEVPANASTATGGVTAIVDKTTGQAYVTGAFFGLSANISGSHIHRGAVGTNGPVIISLTNAGTTAGTFSGAQVILPALVDSFINGLTYVNVHSGSFPGGEIRAQLGNLVLPVKLASIKGVFRKNLAVLTWEALTEENLKHYEIEQQNTQTGAWIFKAAIQGKGIAPAIYVEEDLPINFGQLFVNYRLRIVDKDGRIAYSPVVKINRSPETAKLIIINNPVNNALNYKLTGFNNYEKAEAAIIDFQGRIVSRQTTVGLSNNAINTSVFARGIYILKVQIDGEIITQRFLKE